ncbi:MAG TPA: carbamoyltransferase N-terminal domain-containing protein, partial [Ktedonobacteraceae bacterium]|nr:carbamoyltransferase N-terminal domain-containing protein [Ktedonobacteraceae bacterium]
MNVLGFSGLHNSASFKERALPHLPPRLRRINQSFDAAAALVTDTVVRAAAAEERFSGEKATGAFPLHAIDCCLKAAHLSPTQVDYIAHGWNYEPFKPFFEQGDEISRQQFEQVFSRAAQLQCIHEYLPTFGWAEKLVQVPHHLAHAASTFYLSGFGEALILVADGMGEVHSLTIALGEQTGIKVLKQIPALHSWGILYSVLTFYLGFKPASDEYKVMGLAPYGNPQVYFKRFMELIHLKDDGTYTIPILFANKSFEQRETYSETLRIIADCFGPAREPDAPMTQNHMDIAAGLQNALQASLLHVLRHFKRETAQQNLCMAGGVALNCTANSVIRRSRLFKRMFIQPAAGDDGTALGAALYVQRAHSANNPPVKMALPLWGPEYTDEEIAETLQSRSGCSSIAVPSFEELVRTVAHHLAAGRVVAWFQGRMEFGPRALGNRSILADPRLPGMRDHLNRLIKKRESFRPFAPAVTAEAAPVYFDIAPGEEAADAYMLFVVQVKSD